VVEKSRKSVSRSAIAEKNKPFCGEPILHASGNALHTTDFGTTQTAQRYLSDIDIAE
jgi:hypothetical protein